METGISKSIVLPQSEHVRHVARYSIALITCILGVIDMLSAFVPRMEWSALLGVWPILNHRVPAQTFIVVVGFFLIVLSYGLARGKKHAWRITLILLLLSAVLHVRRSAPVLESVAALALAILIFKMTRFFHAKSDPPSARRGYIALCLGLGIVCFYAIGGLFLLWDDFQPWFDRIGIEGVLLRILSHNPIHIPHAEPRVFFFQTALPCLCISAVLYGMISIFRPVAAVLLPEGSDGERARELVERYGTNSISYFALGEDKSYFFSESGQSVISYVLQGSTAVVAGDPIGPGHEQVEMLRQFMAFCSEQDWSIVFWQTRENTAALYREAGFHLLKIGEDAVLNPQNFTLKGNAIANVRSSAKRAEKDGLGVVFYRGQVTDNEQLDQMEMISRHWLESKGGSEMGFSMGRFDRMGDEKQLYVLAVDGENKVHAFVSFVPVYGRRGWGLDLMRRAEVCAPGTMELLLARTLEYMKNTGAEMVSLGLAPLSNANEEDATFLDNSIDFLTRRFGNPSKNASLFNFKKKFHPTWESRYLVYSGALSLPKIGWALYHAHQTDMTVPRVIRQTLREWKKSRVLKQQTRLQAARA